MEQILLGVAILIVQLVIIVQIGKTHIKLDDLQKEQERHNNIQTVILEQVDKLTEKSAYEMDRKNSRRCS